VHKGSSMSTLFNDDIPNILPKTSFNKHSFLEIVSPLIKVDIIKEGEGRKARNANKLNLTDSIYEKIDAE
jgi:hypothetical protein